MYKSVFPLFVPQPVARPTLRIYFPDDRPELLEEHEEEPLSLLRGGVWIVCWALTVYAYACFFPLYWMFGRQYDYMFKPRRSRDG